MIGVLDLFRPRPAALVAAAEIAAVAMAVGRELDGPRGLLIRRPDHGGQIVDLVTRVDQAAGEILG